MSSPGPAALPVQIVRTLARDAEADLVSLWTWADRTGQAELRELVAATLAAHRETLHQLGLRPAR